MKAWWISFLGVSYSLFSQQRTTVSFVAPVSHKPPKLKTSERKESQHPLDWASYLALSVYERCRFHDLPVVYLNYSCSQMFAYIETDQPLDSLVITCSGWCCELVLIASHAGILSQKTVPFLQSPPQ